MKNSPKYYRFTYDDGTHSIYKIDNGVPYVYTNIVGWIGAVLVTTSMLRRSKRSIEIDEGEVLLDML